MVAHEGIKNVGAACVQHRHVSFSCPSEKAAEQRNDTRRLGQALSGIHFSLALKAAEPAERATFSSTHEFSFLPLAMAPQ
jgi:hypothetical protein